MLVPLALAEIGLAKALICLSVRVFGLKARSYFAIVGLVNNNPNGNYLLYRLLVKNTNNGVNGVKRKLFQNNKLFICH